MKGTLKTWLETKGYGFVQVNQDSPEIFIHVSNFVEGKPKIGAEVEFEIGDPASIGKKPQAVRARIISIPERKDLVGGVA